MPPGASLFVWDWTCMSSGGDKRSMGFCVICPAWMGAPGILFGGRGQEQGQEE